MNALKLSAIAVVVLALVAAPASASTYRLTTHEARSAARIEVENGLGTLLSRSLGSAPVSVGKCRVHARRGRCSVVVDGLQRCSLVIHALKVRAGILTWGTNIACEASAAR